MVKVTSASEDDRRECTKRTRLHEERESEVISWLDGERFRKRTVQMTLYELRSSIRSTTHFPCARAGRRAVSKKLALRRRLHQAKATNRARWPAQSRGRGSEISAVRVSVRACCPSRICATKSGARKARGRSFAV